MFHMWNDWRKKRSNVQAWLPITRHLLELFVEQAIRHSAQHPNDVARNVHKFTLENEKEISWK